MIMCNNLLDCYRNSSELVFCFVVISLYHISAGISSFFGSPHFNTYKDHAKKFFSILTKSIRCVIMMKSSAVKHIFKSGIKIYNSMLIADFGNTSFIYDIELV